MAAKQRSPVNALNGAGLRCSTGLSVDSGQPAGTAASADAAALLLTIGNRGVSTKELLYAVTSEPTFSPRTTRRILPG